MSSQTTIESIGDLHLRCGDGKKVHIHDLESDRVEAIESNIGNIRTVYTLNDLFYNNVQVIASPPPPTPNGISINTFQVVGLKCLQQRYDNISTKTNAYSADFIIQWRDGVPTTFNTGFKILHNVNNTVDTITKYSVEIFVNTSKAVCVRFFNNNPGTGENPNSVYGKGIVFVSSEIISL